MIFFACSCLTKFIRSYAIYFINFHIRESNDDTVQIIINQYANNQFTAPIMNNVDKKTKASNKPPVHEIINLDDSTAIVPALQQQLFVADLASQCGSLLNWASDTNNEVLAQLLWKNKMRIKALQRYQQLDNDQIRKLVDRDWRVMNQTNKKEIVSNHKKVNYNDLQSRFDTLKEKLNNQKRIKNGQ